MRIGYPAQICGKYIRKHTAKIRPKEFAEKQAATLPFAPSIFGEKILLFEFFSVKHRALTKDQMETLSRIVAEWNARYGKSFDTDVAASSLLTLRGTLSANEKVRRSARVNSKRDFANTVEDQAEEAIVENYDKNREWYSFLLSQPQVGRELLHLLVDGLYDGIRREEGDGD